MPYPPPTKDSKPTIPTADIDACLKKVATADPNTFNFVANKLATVPLDWPSDARWYVVEYWLRYRGYLGGLSTPLENALTLTAASSPLIFVCGMVLRDQVKI